MSNVSPQLGKTQKPGCVFQSLRRKVHSHIARRGHLLRCPCARVCKCSFVVNSLPGTSDVESSARTRSGDSTMTYAQVQDRVGNVTRHSTTTCVSREPCETTKRRKINTIYDHRFRRCSARIYFERHTAATNAFVIGCRSDGGPKRLLTRICGRPVGIRSTRLKTTVRPFWETFSHVRPRAPKVFSPRQSCCRSLQ